MLTALFVIVLILLLALQFWVMLRGKWYNLKKTMPISTITIRIDWTGSAYLYAPPRITVEYTENWRELAAAALKESLTTMEVGSVITEVELEASPVLPDDSGKITINKTDIYGYTVEGNTSYDVPNMLG